MNLRPLYKTAFLTILCISIFSCATIAGVDEPAGGPSGRSGSTFPYDRYVEGKPDFDIRIEGGIYIWKVENSWHLRVAKKVDRPRAMTPFGPVISGSVMVEQAIIQDTRKYQVSQVSDVRSRQKEITFRIEQRENVSNEVEGFDFKVRPTGLDYCVTFDILIDGAARPDMVRLGSFRHRPEEMPLTICLHSRN